MSKVDLSSGKPVVTILTLVAAVVAVVVGGIVTITNPQSLSFHQYIQDIAFMAGALGLGAGIGRGIDSYGSNVAQAQPVIEHEVPVEATETTVIPVPVEEAPVETSPVVYDHAAEDTPESRGEDPNL